MKRPAATLAGVGLLLGLAAPGAAQACAVCFDPNDVSRNAYVYTAVFLTFLPLALAGGLFLWVRRRSAALSAAPARTTVRLDQMNGISSVK